MRKWILNNGTKIHRILGGRSNVYLIQCHTRNVLVDTGKNGSGKKLLNILHKRGIQRIDWLILTHTHFDHCQNAALLQKKFNCQIRVSGKARTLIQNGYAPLPAGTNKLSTLIRSIGIHIGSRRFSFESFAVEEYIDDPKTIESGTIRVELIPTPGHSADSMCIVVNNEIALVGDTLFGILPNSVFPPFADDPLLLKQQWRKLLDTGCHTFLPGHGGPITKTLLERCLQKQNA